MSPLSLYEQLLGPRYARLPAALQRFHRLRGHHQLHGQVTIAAPACAAARVLAFVLGTPPCASSGPLLFELSAHGDGETWTRHFPMRTMRSRMRQVSGGLEERLGPVRLHFELLADAGQLTLQLRGLRFVGVPCPAWLRPRIVAKETEQDGRLHFDVAATLPLLGTVAAYRGHLDVPAGAPS